MSAENIIAQIQKDAQQEITKINKEAEKQAQIIITRAKKEAKQEADKLLATAKQHSETRHKILISQANQEAKRNIMNAQEKIIDDCFMKARHKLATLSDNEYKTLVTTLIKSGMKKIGRDCSILASRSADKVLAKQLGLSVSGMIERAGGVVLVSADNRVTLDITFDGILKREQQPIRNKVGKLLFS